MQEAEQAEKPTVVGIGVQGGFPNEDYEIREELSLVRLPDFAFLSLPVDGLPEEVLWNVMFFLTISYSLCATDHS